MLYPLKTSPVFKDYIWGGKKLSEFYNKKSNGNVAESWEISCFEDNPSLIVNGEFKGMKLHQVIDNNFALIMGQKAKKYKKFPLLVKLLDANKDLSVQVHPDGENGKTEMWYIIDAKPGSKIGYGFKGDVTKDEVKKAIENGSLESLINYIEVKTADSFFIPAGTVHCLCEGLLVAEIQQASDVTYRLYDYNRKDSDGNLRELHIDKALEVANLSSSLGKERLSLENEVIDDTTITLLAKCEYFKTFKYNCKTSHNISMNCQTFETLTFIRGSGQIKYSGSTEKFEAGDSFLMPACLCMYEIIGDCEFLRSMLP